VSPSDSKPLGRVPAGHPRTAESDQIALEGVDASDPPAVADSRDRAVDATASAERQQSTADVAQRDSNAVGEQIAPESRTAPSGMWPAAATGAKANVSEWFG